MPIFIDLTGETFGRLTVLSRAEDIAGRVSWNCRCSCGKELVARAYNLRGGKTQSCGCLQREWARSKRTKHGRARKPDYTREIHLMRKYKLPIDAYNQMLAEQQHKCAICGYDFGKERGDTYVDHCHTTGDVRGLLCRACNAGIGQLKDDVSLLKNAIAYLQRSSRVHTSR